MRISCFIVTIWLGLSTAAWAGPAAREKDAVDAALTRQLKERIEAFQGQAGVYVRHLGSGKTSAVHADELFPTASLVKVPILLGLFARIQARQLDYHRVFVYRAAEREPTEGMLSAFKDGETVDTALLATLMMQFSDNVASLWCQELAGGGAAINRWLDGKGFSKTRVNSRTPGREKAKEDFGWGQTTPREMAELLVRIHDRRAVGPAADEEMIRVLSRNYHDGRSLAEIPPTVHTMSKTGAVDDTRSEVVLVDAPSGAYVFCVITKGQKDQRWGKDNEGLLLIRDVSRILWNRFEPNSHWSPAPDPDGRFR